MKFPLGQLLLAALLLGVTPGCEATAPSVPLDEEGWVSLFDGESTSGWRGYRSDEVPEAWGVEEGALVLDGSGGDLITVGTYGDFVLELEWRISSGGNSGIFFRATEETPTIYFNAPEVQILDNAGTGTEPTSVHAAGANYGLHAPPRDSARPAGEWNHVRLEVSGDRVRQLQNGELVCDYELGSPAWEALVSASKFGQWPAYGRARRGHIGLQDHGNRVAFRELRIQVLDASEREGDG